MKTTKEQIKTRKCPKCGMLLEIKKAETYFVLNDKGKTLLETEVQVGCEDCDVSYTVRYSL